MDRQEEVMVELPRYLLTPLYDFIRADVIIYILIALTLAAGIAALTIQISSLRRRVSYREDNLRARTAKLEGLLPPSFLNSLDEPRIKNFIALNDGAVMRLYSQTAESVRAADVREEEVSGNVENSGSFRFKWFGYDSKNQRASLVREKFEPQKDPIKALAVVVEQLSADGSLQSIDLTTEPSNRPLMRLLSSLQLQAERIGIGVPQVAQEAIKAEWNARRNHLDVKNIRKLSGFIKIKASFDARQDEPDISDVTLTVSKDSQDTLASIAVVVHHDWIVANLNRNNSTASFVHAICFGIVDYWDEQTSTLSIAPIAIYSA